jgi:hypothetical protein
MRSFISVSHFFSGQVVVLARIIHSPTVAEAQASGFNGLALAAASATVGRYDFELPV